MKRKLRMQPIQILAIGFGLIIIIGGLLLSTPFVVKTGQHTSLIDGLFSQLRQPV